MVALFVQTLLLVGAAYFIGAALGCLVRRAFFSAESEAAVATSAERRADPLPEVATGAARFARSGESEVRIVPPPTAQPVPQPAPAVPVPPAMRPALVQPQPVAPPPPAPPAASAEAQDLRCIRLIDAGLEAALGKLGVRRYEQIAAWKQADVQRINDGLGLKGRISQENWIEQAQVLAKGGETHFSARRARGEAANAEPTPDEGERRPMAASVGVAPRASTGGAAGVAVEVAMATMAAAAAPQAARAAPYTEPKVSERAAFAASAPLAASPTAPTVPAAIPIR